MNLSNFLRGNTGNGNMCRHILKYNAPCTNSSTLANLDIAEDFRSRPNQDTRTYLRMPVATLLPRASQGDLVQDRDIVINHGCLACHETRSVIQ